MEPAVVVALVASATSITVALASAGLSYTTQRRIQSQSAHRQARLDYEYEARKRLYEVTEPLLFQLGERGEDLQSRIAGLARTARNGDLEPGRGWLSDDGYYLRSIVHRVLAPVAIFHLMQDGLTRVDLRLDPEIRTRYGMAKLLAWALTDHFTFAAQQPELPYDPYAETEYEMEHPADEPYLQGLPSGLVETAGQALIVQVGERTARVMRFGEFDEAYSDRASALHLACAPVTDLFRDFHPRSHPVLWRALVTQARLCAALTSTEPGGPEKYDWRRPGEQVEASVIAEPLEVARKYLDARLPSAEVARP
ncbi:hypothetical protein FKR81_40585 [Lentzea tibetensis]|uniref:Uncharacterized protein n=1 Tax=Lentzea tibetensis TaxID=2591470 RepID=A0A563EFR1_9PSEU|nr:hypothetical protein [Lentzea tibetensis]TWP44900.1 hypothetical protein FKR81_40585 [Lentzea tibetensis]